jgi:hypothetical protein
LTLKLGDQVTFRIDGQRAKDILVEQEAQIPELVMQAGFSRGEIMEEVHEQQTAVD